jgi:quinol monooxygenase YgiN
MKRLFPGSLRTRVAVSYLWRIVFTLGGLAHSNENCLMIAVVATLTVNPGSQAAFEEAASAMVLAVRANEPGCLLYTIAQSRSDPCVYSALELYRTEEDLAAHRDSAHVKALSPAIAPFLAGKPVIALHNVISGVS